MSPFTLTVPMYHYVRDSAKTAYPKLWAIPPAEFEMQLDYLQKNYAVISWDDLKKFLKGEGALPENACLITFDDGVKDHYQNAFPALKRRGLSGLFFAIARPNAKMSLVHMLQFLIAKFGESEFRDMFLEELNPAERNIFDQKEQQCLADNPTAKFGDVSLRALKMVIQKYMPDVAGPIVERLFERHIGNSEKFAKDFYLSPEDMEEMKKGGMHFGGHGTNHMWFNWISPKERGEEIAGSVAMLRGIEEAPFIFSYPYGDYSPEHFSEVEKYGFCAAVTANKEFIHHSNPFEIHRIDAFQLIQRLEKTKE